jgi:hypothetical protein
MHKQYLKSKISNIELKIGKKNSTKPQKISKKEKLILNSQISFIKLKI